MLEKYVTLVVCALTINSVHSTRCHDVDVRNNILQFEVQLRNCSIITGYLQIVLIEFNRGYEFENISFPELIEVQGFLLVYRVYGLTTLGTLFPNLNVIWGHRLLADYSFVVYDMLQLQEIGLRNLNYIARGSIRIDKCPHLCYVESVNWTRILNPAHDLHYFNTNVGECQKCPSQCNGVCWNQNFCQTDPAKCHPQCIGCSGPGADKCHSCRFYKDEKKCVSKCPKNKFRHSVLPYCVTKKECLETAKGPWWIFQGVCVKSCPARYKETSEEKGWCELCKGVCRKMCKAGEVDSIASAQQFLECTHIEGELTIRINSKAAADELERNLGLIEEIDFYLKIYRSSAVTSLDFLKNLKVIHGKELYNGKYALVAYENPSLRTLWNWDKFKTKIGTGTLMFHYNSQLCTSEIEKLKNITGLEYSDLDVSPHSNGDKKACNFIDLNVTIDELTSKSVKLTWENVTFNSNRSRFIGYLVYYAEDPFMKMTFYNDECEDNWNVVLVSNNSLEITNLNAHAKYAYYIKTYITLPSLAAHTEIDYFDTESDDPSNPTHVETSSNSSDSIILTWGPPEFPNGVLSYYVVVTYFEKDDPKFLERRNYCEYPHHIHVEEVAKAPNVIWFNSTEDNSTCICETDNKMFKAIESKCDTFDIFFKPKLRSIGCKPYTYSVDDTSRPSSNDNVSIVLVERKSNNLIKRSAPSTDSPDEISIFDPNLTSYEIKGLKHFSMYVILLTACNNESQCSGHEMVSQRTLSKVGADDIPPGLSVSVDSYDAVIKWSEPKDPNALIVAYYVEHKRTDLEHSKAMTECLTRQEYAYFGHKYRMRNFLPGRYLVRVKAISLAGSGKFTDTIEFEITLSSHDALTTFMILFIILVVLIPVFVFCYQRYKRKNSIDQLRLLANINSSGTGSDYVEDEWEIDRTDVEIIKELGKGTFGSVYNGILKSQDRPCAVKTISDQAQVRERIDFLNEASTMKLFSDAHHVVKLIGVVSRGHPPLVVMELMARGDLKSVLRQSRSSSSSNITCAEMYRMAAEIADGMMYLAVKKFVHRDLAARNCMVSADHTVKIGDFGMTRDIYETDYYRKEAGGLMPIRWMSPESLADGVFTSDSDVWSYGVVLWEIVTLAEQPYQGLANEQVLQFVTAQGTLQRPQECPDLLYEIMEACWKWKPNHRPLFEDIVGKLELHIGQHFRLVSFYHSSEGEEYKINPRDRVYNPPALSMPFNRNAPVYWDATQDDFSL